MKKITIKDQAEVVRLCFKEAQTDELAAKLNAAATTLLSLSYLKLDEVYDALKYAKPTANTPEAVNRHLSAMETMKQLTDYIKNGQPA